MSTPLTRQQRTWRVRIFATTWLSYVGFYFCRTPFSAAKGAIGEETGWDATTLGNIWAAYLIAYAVGQFLASQMGQRLGPRRNVLLGMGVSVMVTLALGITLSVPIMMGLVAVNGLAQATGWSGNVGTMAGWFHKHERGRVMGVWSTNFVVGSLASGAVMALVLSLRDSIIDIPFPLLSTIGVKTPAPWRWCFYVGAIFLTLVWLQFYFLQRNKPEDAGLAPIDDPKTPEDESKQVEPPSRKHELESASLGLSRNAWINLFLVAGFYFFAKFIRYAVWSWAAYFLQTKFELSAARSNLYSTIFVIAGVVGVWVTGWLSDRFFDARRAGVSLIMMLGMIAATALMMAFGGTSANVFVVLLGLVGFTLMGPDALLTGAGAIDIGGRKAATFAAAMISGFGSTGAVLQEIVIPRLYDSKEGGDLGIVFVLLFGSAVAAAVFCGILTWRNRNGKGI